MSDANLTLRELLTQSYGHLLGQLGRRLRSTELAQEALHDTYLHLERGKEIREVENPLGYLLRMAINVAHDKRRKNGRLLTFMEIEAAFDLADDAPGPAHHAEARSELAVFETALAELPTRRQAIFLAYFSENLQTKEIAQRFGLSVRMIEVEIRRARDHCARAMKKLRKK